MSRSDGETRLPSDPKRTARITGALYLLIFVTAGFAEGYVRATLVGEDPASTAANVRERVGLFRLGFVADVIAFLADAAVAVLLYVLLRSTGRTVALLAAAFRLVAHPAIAATNLLNQYVVLRILDGAGPLAAFDAAQREGLATLALQLHGDGYLLGGAFFGVHCALLGYLLVRSELFPSWLGALVGLAAAGYLAESFTHFLAPAHGEIATGVVVVTAGVGEFALCLYLLIRGARQPGNSSRADRPASSS